MTHRKLIPFVAVLLVAVALTLASCVNSQGRKGESELVTPIPSYGAAPLIRVKLSKPSAAPSVTVDAGKATISLDGSRFDTEGPLTLALKEGAVDAGEYGSATSVEITPAGQPTHFDIDGRLYRGRVRLIAERGTWDVVNVIDLEQYVAGVIGWEMIASWPVEALKAQAVASRTYALFEMEKARANGKNWDLDDTTQYQVYGGVGPADKQHHWRETASVLKARELTTGQVLTYKGKGFKAFFHSTSGGHTVSPMAGLGLDEVIEPLRGVEIGGFGKESPKHSWEIKHSHSEVKARLIEKGISPSDIIRIEAAEAAPSGHAVTLKLFNRTGRYNTISAIRVRQALGLFSTRFEAEKSGDEWIFRGSGYGHGCGMCQWSARGMAASGWQSERILHAMYPGSELKTIY